MKNLILQQEGNAWVRLLGPNSKPFMEYLKYRVKVDRRRYDAGTRAWMVHWRELRDVVAVARGYFQQIDWSTLPTEWQMYLAGAEFNAPVNEEISENPFSVLFVTEDAPIEVVKAAYKALVQVHHPDVGGSTAAMTELNQAYEKILNMRNN